MIQHEGLTAVITVYPIAILLLAVEIRAMEPLVAMTRGAKGALVAGGVISFAVVVLAVSAVNEAVKVLLFGTKISPYAEFVIVIGGAGLGVIVPMALALLMLERAGVWELISARNIKKFQSKSPRELLEYFDRMERLNPSVGTIGADARARLEAEARAQEAKERADREVEARKYGDSDIDPADNV